jgi:hypothetical protein
MQQIVIYYIPQHVSRVFAPIVRRSDCVSLSMVFCPVIVVVMLESRMARCVHCRPPLWSSGQSFWLQIEVPGSIPGATRFSE